MTSLLIRNIRKKTHIIIGLLFILLCVSAIAALLFGSVHIPLQQFFTLLYKPEHSLFRQIILKLRLPRIITAIIVGGLLALSGLLMQILLQNPLADPYVLGISSGASLLTLIAILLGLNFHWQMLASWLGALLAILIVFSLARGLGRWSILRLLLIGIIVAAGFSSLVSLLLLLSPNQDMQTMFFWLVGSFNEGQWPWLAGLILLFGFLMALSRARALNMLNYGHLQAETLGVDVERLSMELFFLSALMTAAAVYTAGAISFIGLISPHLMRLLGIRDYRYLIPASLLTGGIILINADTLARTIIAPQELPVGIITALIGIPIFLLILTKQSSV